MDLKELVKPVYSLKPDEARAFIKDYKEGTYSILDVRQPAEYEKYHIPGSILMPLTDLQERMGQLDPKKPVIVY
ncbi:MAG: hypothetical protein C4582_06630 [Desulfobacteraceae bacterium]|jgi:rhodanese-related sulfurtransferase|nr:MAG: hypothetical protein C4582_06630 [Desulfobacteraceae bacterium]